MARSSMRLSDEERRKFDDVGLDDINAMSDMTQLNKLAKYMDDEGFPQTSAVVKARMASLGSNDKTSNARSPDLDAEVSSFINDLAKWSTNLTQEETLGASEPLEFRPRDSAGTAPIRGTKVMTISETGKTDASKDPNSHSEILGMPTLADLSAAEAQLDGTGMHGVFAEAAKHDKSKDTDLSVQGASKKDVEKMLSALRSAPKKEKQWQAVREKEKGNELFKAREYRSAIESYDVSVALDPTVAAAFANRAAAYMKLKRWSDAIGDCDAALKIDGTHFKALLRRGCCRLEAGETGAAAFALRDLTLAAEIEQSKGASRDAELVRLTEKARKLLSEAQKKKSRAAMKRVAIQESDDEDEATTSSKPSAAPPQPPIAPARQGPMVFEEMEEEEVKGAEDTSVKEKQTKTIRTKIIIEEDSDDEVESIDPAALKDKGNVAFASGEFGDAICCYDRAITGLESVIATNDASTKKQLAVCYANRAASYLKLGVYKKAEADADKSIKTDPAYVKGFHRRAAARSGLGKFEQALEDYEHVVRANPESAQLQKEVNACMEKAAEVMLGNLGGGLGSDVANALGGFKASTTTRTVAIEPDSDDDSSDEDEEVVPVKAKETDVKFAAAPASSEKVSSPVAPAPVSLPAAPTPPPAIRRVAIVEEDSSDEEEEGVTEVFAEDPTKGVTDTNVSALTDKDTSESNLAELAKNKGNIFFKSGDFEKAETKYALAIGLDKGNASYFANRAAARLKLGNTEGALEDADAAIGMDPSHGRARHRRAVCLSLLGRHAECVSEYEHVVELNPGHVGVANEAQAAKQVLMREQEKKKKFVEKDVKEDVKDSASPTPKTPKAPKTPKTATELEVGCKQLKGKPGELFAFLKSVPDRDIPKVIKHSVSAAMLGAYANAFAFALTEANVEKNAVAETLAHLARLPRFAFNVALLGKNEMAKVTEVFGAIGDSVCSELRSAWRA